MIEIAERVQTPEHSLECCGIYGIWSHPVMAIYVGASRQGIAQRWIFHRSRLRHGHHPCIRLQQDWQTFGEASFHCVVLQQLPRSAVSAVYEQEWIERVLHAGFSCYNQRPAHDGSRPQKVELPHDPLPNREILTLQEVSTHLRVNDQMARYFIKSGELRAVRFGRLYRVHRSDLQDFVKRVCYEEESL